MARKRKEDPATGRRLMEGVHPEWSERRETWRYVARYDYTDGSGKRRFRKRVCDTADEAEAWLLERKLELRRGTHSDPSTLTVAAYHDRWFRRKATTWAGSTTLANRQQWERHFAPRLGHLRVRDVTREQCQRVIDDLLAGGLTGQTIRTYMVQVVALFDGAMKDGLRTANPASGLDYPAPTSPVRTVWSPLQMRKFLHTTRDDDLGPLWAFLIATGCRINEALAVQWSDVDLDAGAVLIHRTVSKDATGKLYHRTGTKTSARGRAVPLEPWLIDRLRTLPRHPEAPYVFIQKNGRPWGDHWVREQWKRTVKAAGLPALRLHDLRHGVASALVAAGVDIRTVGDLLGHKTPQVTLGIYAHGNLGQRRKATRTMGDMLGMASPATTEGESAAEN